MSENVRPPRKRNNSNRNHRPNTVHATAPLKPPAAVVAVCVAGGVAIAAAVAGSFVLRAVSRLSVVS